MAARQLPKLKTRVRFPSHAPRIQPALCRFNYWLCGVGREPDQEGSERQLTRTSEYEVRVLRSERGPWSENEHGNQTFPSPAPPIFTAVIARAEN